MKNKSTMMPGETLKWCSRCQSEKPPGEFHKNRSRLDGLQNYCKPCSLATQADTDRRHPEAKAKRVRKSTIKRKYGLSLEQFETLLFDQNGKCAICSNLMDNPEVDHDHSTGAVRALLCDTCNKGLGMFHDSTDKLFRAISYLDSFKVLDTSI